MLYEQHQSLRNIGKFTGSGVWLLQTGHRNPSSGGTSSLEIPKENHNWQSTDGLSDRFWQYCYFFVETPVRCPTSTKALEPQGSQSQHSSSPSIWPRRVKQIEVELASSLHIATLIVTKDQETSRDIKRHQETSRLIKSQSTQTFLQPWIIVTKHVLCYLIVLSKHCKEGSERWIKIE